MVLPRLQQSHQRFGPGLRPGPKREHGDRGAVSVELAFVLPILILLLFGIVEFSIAYNRTQALHAAAREGARVASQPYATQSDIEDRVIDALHPVTFESTPEITIDPSTNQPCNLRNGQAVSVQVKAAEAIEIPLWPGGPMNLTLTGKGEFRCE